MFLERILRNAFPGESGAARLQQLGLFTLIYLMQGDEEPVTARRLAEVTEQSDGDVSRRIKKLLALDLIERSPIGNPQGGRGQAYKITIKESPETKRLIKKINETSSRKRKA